MEPDYKVILVGDARMAVQELTERYGAVNYYQRNETPGIIWLRRFAGHFTHCVWLNPEGTRYWNDPSVMLIRNIFPMYEFTLEGLGEAIKKLIVKR